jgi:hypothetical protein
MSGPFKRVISYGELRSLVIEFLAESMDDPTLQFNSLRDGVGRVAARRGLLNPNEPALSPAQVNLSCDIVWDLIVEGVLRPGHPLNSPPAPNHFHVTERGRGFLTSGSLSPYDLDTYLKRLDSEVPGLGPLIRMYLVESLDTFRIGSTLTSTVTFGCASECAILALIGVYIDALPKHVGEALKKKISDKPIKTQFDEFTKSVNAQLQPVVFKQFKDTRDTGINSIIEMYRVNRNEAGHPTGKRLRKKEADVNLRIFPYYIKNPYGLIDWSKRTLLCPRRRPCGWARLQGV